MNPEVSLLGVAGAIRYRTISTTHHWRLVYYYDRITCVPSNINVPPEIIIGEFTEKMTEDGFTTAHWGDIQTQLTKLLKELKK